MYTNLPLPLPTPKLLSTSLSAEPDDSSSDISMTASS